MEGNYFMGKSTVQKHMEHDKSIENQSEQSDIQYQNIYNYLELGNNYFEQGNIQKALIYFHKHKQQQQQQQQDISKPDDILKIVQSLRMSNLHSVTIDILERYIILEESDSFLYHELGRIYQNNDNLEQALLNYQKGFLLDPTNRQYVAEINAVQKILSQRQYMKLKESGLVLSDDYETNLELGILLKLAGDEDKAILTFQKCIVIDNIRNEANYQIADFYFSKDLKEVKQFLKNSYFKNDQCSISLFKLGLLYNIKNNRSKAFSYFLKCIHSMTIKKCQSSLDLYSFAERLSDSCYQIQEYSDDSQNLNNYDDDEQIEKNYRIIFDIKDIKQSFLSQFKDLNKQSLEFQYFFYNFGLIIVINILLDKIISKVYEKQNTKTISLIKSNSTKEKRKHFRQRSFQQQNTSDRPKRFIIQFKDTLKCLGSNKVTFEFFLNLSILLKNEYELLVKIKLAYKYQFEMSKLISCIRILDLSDKKFSNSCLFKPCFDSFLGGNFEKIAQMLLQFKDIKNEVLNLMSVLLINERFNQQKVDLILQNLQDNPMHKQSLLMIQEMIHSMEQQNKTSEVNCMKSRIAEYLYNGFVIQNEDNYIESYSIKEKYHINQIFANSDLFTHNHLFIHNDLFTHKDLSSHNDLKLSSQKCDQTINELSKYIEKKNNNYLSFFFLGNIQMSRYEYSSAKDSYYQCLLLNPLFEKAYLKYAIVLNKLGDISSAVQYLDYAYDMIGLDSIIRSHISQYFLKLDGWIIFNEYYKENYAFYQIEILLRRITTPLMNVEQFITQFQSNMCDILKRNDHQIIPEDINEYFECIQNIKFHKGCKGFCYFSLYLSFRNQEKMKKAIKYLKKSALVNSDLFEIEYISQLIQVKHFNQALSLLTDILDNDPTNAAMHHLHAKYYFEKGQYNKCILYLTSLIEKEIVTPDIYKLLANAYRQLDQTDNSLKYYHLYLAQKPYDTEVFVLQSLTQIIKAWEAQTQNETIFKSQWNYNFLLVQTYLKINNAEKTLSAVKQLFVEEREFAEKCKSDVDLERLCVEIKKLDKVIILDRKGNKQQLKLEAQSFEASQIANSINYLKKNIKQNPTFIDPYLILSDIYETIGELQKQIKVLNSLIKYNPNYQLVSNKISMIHFRQGYELYSIGQYDAALCFLEEYCTQKQVQNRHVYYTIAMCYLRTNQLENAIYSFQECILTYPDMYQSYIHLGMLYYNQQNYPKSYQYLSLLLQFNPQHANGLLFIGKIFYAEKDYAKAYKCFEECINICDRIPDIYIWLSRVCTKLKLYDEAIQCVRVALNFEYQRLEDIRIIGFTLFKLKQYNQAINQLKCLQNTGQADEQFHHILAECYYQAKDYDKAQAIYLAILKQSSISQVRLYQIKYKQNKPFFLINPKQNISKKQVDDIHYQMAFTIFNERRSYDQVLFHINSCLHINPDHKLCLILKAEYIFKIDKSVELAMQQFNKLDTQFMSQNIQSLIFQSRVHQFNGMVAESMDCIDKVLQQDLSNEEAIYLKGMIHYKQNQQDQAYKLFINNQYHYQSLKKTAKILANDTNTLDLSKSYFKKAVQAFDWKYLNYQYIAEIEFIQKNFKEAIFYFQKVSKVKDYVDYAILNKIAMSFKQDNQFIEAIHNFKNSLEIKKDQWQAHQMIGECYLNINNYELAIISYNSSYILNENNIDCLYQLGNLYKRKQDYDKSKQFYVLCLKLNNTHSDCLNNLGEVYYKERQYEDALKCFGECVAQNKKHYVCLMNQSKIFRKVNKDYYAAMDILVRINLIDKNNLRCVVHLLKVYILAKKMKSAAELYQLYQKHLEMNDKIQLMLAELCFKEKDFDQILKLFQNNSASPFNLTRQFILAKCYYIQKQYEKCEQSLALFTKNKAENHFYFNFLSAMILIKKGISKKVVFLFKRCIEIEPDNEVPYYFLSLFYTKNDKSKAQSYLKRAIELREDQQSEIRYVLQSKLRLSNGNCEEDIDEEQMKSCSLQYPEGELCQYELGQLYLRRNENEKAKQSFQKIIYQEKFPLTSIYQIVLSHEEVQDSRLGLAIVYQRQDRIQKALEVVKTCLSIDPNYSKALRLNATLLRAIGNFSSSIISIQKYIENNPSSDEAHYFLGSMHLEQYKYSQAIYFFKRCLVINPKYPNVYEKLAEAYEKDQQYDDALACYRNYKKTDPQNLAILQNITSIMIRFEEFQEAMQCVIELIELFPENSQNYYLKGLIQKKQGYLNEAIDSLNLSLKYNSTSIPALTQLALIFSLTQDVNNEKKLYKQIIKIEPSNILSLNNLGSLYKLDGKIDKAASLFQECIRIDKYRSEYYSNLAQCYYSKKMYNEALESLRYGVFLDNSSLDCIFNLALVYNSQMKITDAIKEYFRLIKINPNFTPAYFNLAQLLKKQGKSHDAIQLYKQYFDKVKVRNNINYFLNLGILQRETKNYDDSKRNLEECINLDKNNQSALFNLALVYREQNHHQKEIDCLTSLVSSYPDSQKYKHHLGIAFKNACQFEKAIEIFQSQIDEDSNQEIYYFNLGDTLHNLRKFHEEIQCYLKCIEANSNFIKCLNNLGIAYSCLNLRDQAIDSFQKYLIAFPRDEICYFNLGNEYFKKGELLLSIQSYEQCLSINQNNIDCLHNYSHVCIQLSKYSQAIISYSKILLLSPSKEIYLTKIKLLQKLL